MAKTIEEINRKIQNGKAVIVTAEEIIGMVRENGVRETAKTVDVVTTGTFSPMCSSGAFLNFGHSTPAIRMGKVWLNDVPAYAGIAAVDAFIGATEPSESLGIQYGGAHVIEDLIAGREVELRAESHGTDCYPRKKIRTLIHKDRLNQAYMFLIVYRKTTEPNTLDLSQQRLTTGNRVGGMTPEITFAKPFIDLDIRKAGQQTFSERRAMHGYPPANLRIQPEAGLHVHLVDVDSLCSIENGQMRREIHAACEFAQERARLGFEFHTVQVYRCQIDEFQAIPVYTLARSPFNLAA